MILINEFEISQWAYCQCYKEGDNEELRDLITHSYYAYLYCKHIKDRDEVRCRIKSKGLLKKLRFYNNWLKRSKKFDYRNLNK